MDKKQAEDFSAEELEAFLQEEQEQRRRQMLRRRIPAKYDLASALTNMTKQELDDIRANLQITGASSLKKAELVEVLIPAVRQFAENWFQSLLLEQYEIFHRFAHQEGPQKLALEESHLDYLRGLGFLAGGAKDGELLWYVPQEVLAVFQKAESAAFRRRVERNTKIFRLAAGLIAFYGLLDYEQLHARVMTYFEEKEQIPFFDFMGIVINGACWQESVTTTDHAMHSYALLDAETLEDLQREVELPYAKFSYEQVYAAGAADYRNASAATKALETFFQQEHGYTEERILDVMEELTILLQNGSEVQELLEYLDELDLLGGKSGQKHLKEYLDAWMENLPLWHLKGHTLANVSAGIAEGKKPAAPPRPRVGRNDPCPCGSGKKYKRCCLDKDMASV